MSVTRRWPLFAVLFGVLFVISIAVGRGACQANINEQQGSAPFDSFSGGDLDSISLTNGGLTLRIPVVSFPQRGSLNLSFFVTNSTKQWFVKTTTSCGSNPKCTPTWVKFAWAPVAGQTGARVTSSVDWRLQTTASNNGDGTATTNLFAVSPDGTAHLMGGSNVADVLYPTYSLDATGLKIAADKKTLILPNGTNLYFPGTVKDSSGMQAMTITDANGNQIQINTAGSNIGWLDTLNRWMPGSVSSTVTHPGVPTTDLSTCPSGTVSANLFNVPGLAGGTRSFKFCYSNVTLQTAFDAPGSTSPTEYGPVTQPLLSAVVLPDLTMWTLSYDNYGSVARLGLPTGGSISYGYITRGQPCNNCSTTTTSRWVSSRTVDANDGTGGHTWTYTYTATTVTVTDPQGNDTVHTISSPVANAIGLYETQTQYYQGSATGGTLLKTVARQYSGSASTFTNTDGMALAVNVVPAQTTVTLPGGQSSRVVDTYDSGAFSEADGSPVVAGSLLQEDRYDFSGALARSIIGRYVWQDNASYKAANLLSLISSSTLTDGSGHQAAQATYAYDQVGVAASGVTTALVAAPAGGNLRGNMTTASRWLNTTGGQVSSLRVYLDSGMPASATDPNGNTTSYGYSCAGAYQSQTTFPTTNGVNHVISGVYDCNTGLLTSFTDENGQVFSYTYFNDMLRLHQSNHPDNGQTTFTYADAITVERQRKIDSTRSDDLILHFDGLGRAIQSQARTPSGTVFTNTTYDSLGRVASVTNPYFTTSDSTYGVTQPQYDALGRVTRVTKSDGSFSTGQYTDNCATASDDSGHIRKACSDALGRLVEVDEPSAAPAGASAGGTLSINGSLQSVVVGGSGASAGSGSVTINPSTGTDRSTQVVSQAAVSATISIALQGQDGTNTQGRRTCQLIGGRTICTWSYTSVADSGTMWFQVSSGGGVVATSAQVTYGTSATTLAQNLGSSAGANSSVSWSYAGGTSFKITAAPGTAGDSYVVTTFIQSSCVNSTGLNSSMSCGAQGWSFSPASGSLTGGTDAVYKTVYDSGTVTITANGHDSKVSFGQNDSANTIAANLVTAINNDTAASVNASASGNVVGLKARFTGAGSNVPLASSYTYDTADFSGANFTTTNSGSTLAGGIDGTAGTTVYDAGTISISVGGYSASVSYGQSSNSTGAQVASALATALSDPNSPVSASASASSITLIYRTQGAGGNVAVTSTSSSNQSQYFSNPSFTSPGTTLTGGTNPQGTLTNAYQTLYSYDTLGNLLNVNQRGDGSQAARVRTFTYDSLSRLLTATNPESGTVTYSYDSNSNLHSKTDARQLTITYAYDQLNRLTSETYSNGVQGPAYFYDSVSFYSAANAIGRLVHASNMTNAASTFSYDAMGRVIFEGNWTPSNPSVTANPVSISYNLLGATTSLTYPSGRQVTFSYNTGDQLDQVQFAQLNGAFVGYNYLSVADTNFYPTSAPKSLTLGNGVVESFSLNQRLQLAEDIVAIPGGTTYADHAYDYTPGANNGNIANVYDKLDSTRTQSFTYDALNRLASAAESRWGVSFVYDPWGNRLQQNVTGGSAFSSAVTVDANNHIQGAPQGCTSANPFCYDASGNLLNDSFHKYNFDIEGRINGVDGSNVFYTYDGLSNRVRKDVAGQPSIEYIYLGSQVLAEHDVSGNHWSDYIFAGSHRIAKADCSASGCAPATTTTYYHSDQVNSSRLLTDGSGKSVWQGTFLPFGEEYNPQATTNHYKFTGKERDAESNLDFFGARNYSSTLGRFVSADWSAIPVPVPYAHLGNPQTLNLYAYVGNNPIGRVDADGHGYAMFDTPNPGGPDLPEATAQGDAWLFGSVGTPSGYGINSPIFWLTQMGQSTYESQGGQGLYAISSPGQTGQVRVLGLSSADGYSSASTLAGGLDPKPRNDQTIPGGPGDDPDPTAHTSVFDRYDQSPQGRCIAWLDQHYTWAKNLIQEEWVNRSGKIMTFNKPGDFARVDKKIDDLREAFADFADDIFDLNVTYNQRMNYCESLSDGLSASERFWIGVVGAIFTGPMF